MNLLFGQIQLYLIHFYIKCSNIFILEYLTSSSTWFMIATFFILDFMFHPNYSVLFVLLFLLLLYKYCQSCIFCVFLISFTKPFICNLSLSIILYQIYILINSMQLISIILSNLPLYFNERVNTFIYCHKLYIWIYYCHFVLLFLTMNCLAFSQFICLLFPFKFLLL